MNITHNEAEQKFSTPTVGGEAFIRYRRGPQNSYDLYFVFVPVEARGQNIADQLVRKALQQAQAENAKVIATCSYVSTWFDRHPDQSEILLK